MIIAVITKAAYGAFRRVIACARPDVQGRAEGTGSGDGPDSQSVRRNPGDPCGARRALSPAASRPNCARSSMQRRGLKQKVSKVLRSVHGWSRRPCQIRVGRRRSKPLGRHRSDRCSLPIHEAGSPSWGCGRGYLRCSPRGGPRRRASYAAPSGSGRRATRRRRAWSTLPRRGRRPNLRDFSPRGCRRSIGICLSPLPQQRRRTRCGR